MLLVGAQREVLFKRSLCRSPFGNYDKPLLLVGGVIGLAALWLVSAGVGDVLLDDFCSSYQPQLAVIIVRKNSSERI